MKITSILFVCLILIGSLLAQTDTVLVPAKTGTATYVNSLIDYIVADTNSAGEQLHKVYKLQRGEYYVIDQAVDLRNPVHIVADAPEAGDPTKVPARILSNTTESSETSTQNLINTWADLTIKNVWLGGMSLNGSTRGWGYPGNAISVWDSMVTITLDGIWLDYNGWSCIGNIAPHTNWYISNLHARNLQNPGDPWTTFLFWFENASVVDTFVIRNSTYFQSNSFFLFAPAVVKYLKVDHCTIVNTLKWPFHHTQWLEASITNNIFYNTSALSLTENEEEGQDPDHLEYGLINIDTLFANESDTIPAGPYTIPESQRSMIVKNNIYYWTSGIETYWSENDSVKASLWMNSRTEAMFADDVNYPGLIAENNWNQDPQFNDFAGLSNADQKLADVCVSFRNGSIYQWDWDSDTTTYPDLYEIFAEYPLPESFRSYSGLIGTDGNPLGDLTHYPPELVGIGDIENVPQLFSLDQNYPNPFNPTTTITYSLNKPGEVRLSVYNLLGQKVATLVNNQMNAGEHSVKWNAKNDAGVNVTNGLYFYKLEMENTSITKKMLLVK